MPTLRSTAALALLAFAAFGCSADSTTGPGDGFLLLASIGSDPSPLTAATLSDTKVSVSWQDKSPNEQGFEVHRSSSGATGAFALVATTPAKSTAYTDGGLTPSTDYCYKVRAFRNNGGKPTYSAFSNVGCAKTFGPPAPPQNVSAVPNDLSRVIVSWSAAAGATGYSIERATSLAGDWMGIAGMQTAGPYVDSQRAAEQQVCYRVSASNTWGITAGTPDCTVPPAVPTNPAVAASPAGGLDLTWTDASAVEDGYEVQRATADLQFTTVAVVPRNTTLYHDAAATPDVRYWYRIRATKDGGYTDFSGWADGVNASTTPDAPTEVSANAIGSSSVAIGWTETSANGAGFRIERSTNGGPWMTAATLPWSQSNFDDNTVAADDEHCYRVVAFNGKGDSPASPVDCARPIKAATDLVATSAGSSAIDLTWTDASAFETGYQVVQIACYGGYYYYNYCYTVAAWDLPAGSSQYRVTGLSAGSLYTFAVYAIGTKNGSVYASDESNEASASTDP